MVVTDTPATHNVFCCPITKHSNQYTVAKSDYGHGTAYRNLLLLQYRQREMRYGSSGYDANMETDNMMLQQEPLEAFCELV